MNAVDQMKDAIASARLTQRAADSNTAEMASMVAGRLRPAGASVGVLRALKRELRDFNIHTGSWVWVLPNLKRETLPLSLVRASGEYLPLKLRAFLDFVTPRLKARLAVEF